MPPKIGPVGGECLGARAEAQENWCDLLGDWEALRAEHRIHQQFYRLSRIGRECVAINVGDLRGLHPDSFKQLARGDGLSIVAEVDGKTSIACQRLFEMIE